MSKSTSPRVVKGMPSVELDREEFERRFRQRHADPLFDEVEGELTAVLDAAWQAYTQHRKAPRTREAGPEFADPSYELSLDWLAARDCDWRSGKAARGLDAAAPRACDQRLAAQ